MNQVNLNQKVPKNTSKKLFHPWTGPFKVLKKLSECTYWIQKTEAQNFNRLKLCPKDIWFAQSTSVHSSATALGSHSQTSQQPLTPQLVGTHLEFIDDDDYVNVNESPVGDHSNTTQDQPPIETRRYSTRQHRPPARLQDYRKCWRWDIFSVEGDSVTKRQSLSIIYLCGKHF